VLTEAELNPNNLQRTVPALKYRGVSLYPEHKGALVRHKELFGDMRVPYNFVVPWSRDWPEELYGLMLGGVVGRIRQGAQYVDKWEELTELGFKYGKQADPKAAGWDVVKAALLAYKADKNDLKVPKSFVVPSDDTDWPERTWGIKLGSIVNDIRGKGYYKKEHEQELQEMGLV
jgi:hypothetical protein